MARTRRARVADIHEIASALPGVEQVEGGRGVYQVSRKSFLFFRGARPDAFDSSSPWWRENLRRFPGSATSDSARPARPVSSGSTHREWQIRDTSAGRLC